MSIGDWPCPVLGLEIKSLVRTLSEHAVFSESYKLQNLRKQIAL